MRTYGRCTPLPELAVNSARHAASCWEGACAPATRRSRPVTPSQKRARFSVHRNNTPGGPVRVTPRKALHVERLRRHYERRSGRSHSIAVIAEPSPARRRTWGCNPKSTPQGSPLYSKMGRGDVCFSRHWQELSSSECCGTSGRGLRDRPGGRVRRYGEGSRKDGGLSPGVPCQA